MMTSNSHPRSLRLVAGLSLSVAALAACSDDTPTSAPHTNARYEWAFQANEQSFSIAQDETASITATITNLTLDQTIVRPDFNAQVLDEDLAEIVKSGKSVSVRGLKPGTTSIVYSWGPHRDTVALQVTANPIATFTITPGDTAIYNDETVQFRAVMLDAAGDTLGAHRLSWKVSDTTVAKVSKAGLLTPIDSVTGTVELTATAEDRTGTFTVTIGLRPVATVTVSPEPVAIQAGKTQQLAATLKAANGKTLTKRAVTWTSSDETVATVDESGKVTAVAGGMAIITATSEGRSGTARIHVDG